ncbi:MAG: DUF349 domain-containing protein [Ornithinimicrobium sp.]
MPTPAGPNPDSLAFGRVDPDGTVLVRTADGERAVGSYPGSTEAEALAYFARKFDELMAAAVLLEQRLDQTDLSAHEAREALKTLRGHIGEANVVGDLALLESRVVRIEAEVGRRAQTESQRRAEAKATAGTAREKVVRAAEKVASRDPAKTQWKSASARMRELFEEWKSQQHAGPRLDKPVEDELWRRFTHARSEFDKTRRAWFTQLEQEQDSARHEKERLVSQAEALASSKDWAAGAGEFKRLMEAWRRAGRAQRATDDALWERFKAAQDQFFNAKDEVVAAERVQFEANLTVKEHLLEEAEALVPITDLGAAKRQLRSIQERWDEAGKVPRSDMQRIEGRLKKVEQAVRDAEDRRWKRSNPEVTARAQSMVQQLEKAVADLESDLAAATERGDDARVAAAEQALAARREWLASARAGLAD